MKTIALAMLFAISAIGKAQTPPPAIPAPMTEHHEHKAKVASTTLRITAKGKTTIFTLADLQAMPQHTLVVHNGHSKVDESYTGVGLSDLLAKAGYTLENGGHKTILHSYVRAEGTDKYFVLYAAAELEPDLHTGDSIVALTVDGKPLGEDGQFKMIVAGDKKPARWVTNLEALTVVTLE